jgi:hypothetical protein
MGATFLLNVTVWATLGLHHSIVASEAMMNRPQMDWLSETFFNPLATDMPGITATYQGLRVISIAQSL